MHAFFYKLHLIANKELGQVDSTTVVVEERKISTPNYLIFLL